jgi:RimJ/RimL family protein N-acetyltransferase
MKNILLELLQNLFLENIFKKMHREYKCLSYQEFTNAAYKLVPIRDNDKYDIMRWRNEQIDILRQKELLTQERQEWYFKNVVDKLFEQEKPVQLLFSFLENDMLIGYGGLVHIDWESKNAEISFITATERNANSNQFVNDWQNYLAILKKIASVHLDFVKIYTYAYDIRPQLFKMLLGNNFIEEAQLKKHIIINDKLRDVLIHSCFFDKLILRVANEKDMLKLFEWANDEQVRKNSFNQDKIELQQHKIWFENKCKDSACLILVASVDQMDVGQIRFEIDFSINKEFRGKGYGSDIIKRGMVELFGIKPSVKKIIGKVKKGNTSSGKAFLKAGFKLAKNSVTNNEFNIYCFDK